MHGVLVEAEQLGEVVGLVRHERGQRVLALQRRRGGALAPTGGRCRRALLRRAAAAEHHPSRADGRDLRHGRRDWEPGGAWCVKVAAGAAHSRCARGDAPVGRAGRQTAVFGRGCKARNILAGSPGRPGHESRGGADLLPVGLATPHTPPRFRGAGGSPSRECARQNAAQTRVGLSRGGCS